MSVSQNSTYRKEKVQNIRDSVENRNEDEDIYDLKVIHGFITFHYHISIC